VDAAMRDGHEAVKPAERWQQMRRSLGLRLGLALLGFLAATFALLGFVTTRHQRQHLEAATLLSAERFSDLIERSTTYCMLRNDREGLYHIIETIAGEPEVVRIRIFNQEGRISLSTEPAEENEYVDKQAEACYACHASEEPLTRLDRPDRSRIYTSPSGERVLGIINPIQNQPSCSDAACHAHPPDQNILGVLDTSLSLARADADLAGAIRELLWYTLAAAGTISLLTGCLVLWMVHRPVKALKDGTERLAKGDLGFQIDLESGSQLGELAASFNTMSRELRDARAEITAWAETLELRVEEKSRELQTAHDHVVHVEKMASIGKLAATVAHEINNPLLGILTYAKLLRKWLDRGEWGESRQEEIRSSLQLIETESNRCGDIVKTLLRFARAAPMKVEWTNLNAVVERCVRLVEHQLDLAGVQLHLDLDGDLPSVHSDPGQVEQVLLALVINATEALPRGGNIWLRTSPLPATGEVRIDVRDDGVGIAKEILPQIFEPFFTTKESGRSVGLGLAVSQGIVERHGGRIEVSSDPGRETTFTVAFKITGDIHQAPPAEAGTTRQGDPP
jgi:two-component system NtrC family sensor kinase